MKINGLDTNFLKDDSKKPNGRSQKKRGSFGMMSSDGGSMILGFIGGTDDMNEEDALASLSDVLGIPPLGMGGVPRRISKPEPQSREDFMTNIEDSITKMDNATLKLASKAITAELKRRGLI